MLVQVCVRVVESHGMDTVGIYRIPGNTAAVNALKEALNDGFDNVSHSMSFNVIENGIYSMAMEIVY